MSTDQGPGHPLHVPAPLLEVAVTHPRDVAGAHEGGADRISVVDRTTPGGTSPEPATVSAVCKETDLPVRPLLRLNAGSTTTGGEIARLVGLAHDFLAVGAEGVAFGFRTADLTVDVEVCAHLLEALPEIPWTFSSVFDSSLETALAWRQVRRLPGLDAVLSAGSPRGLEAGHEELTERAAADPEVARLVMAGGGLLGEHVPWLVRAGVRQFRVGSSVRPGASWKAHVDAGHVRAWRMLLDDASDRAQGLAPWRPTG